MCSSPSFHATRVILLVLGDIDSLSETDVVTIAKASLENKHLNDCMESKAAFIKRFEGVRERLSDDEQMGLILLGLLSEGSTVQTSVR